MALQRKIAKARNRKLVGTETPVLVEGVSRETDLLWEARMPSQAPEIDGLTLINDFEGAEPKAGQIRRLRVTEAYDYDVAGTLLAPHEDDNFMPVAPLGLINIQAAPAFVIPNQIPAR